MQCMLYIFYQCDHNIEITMYMSPKNAMSPSLFLVSVAKWRLWLQINKRDVRITPGYKWERSEVYFSKICILLLLMNVILPGGQLYVSFSMSPDLVFHNAFILCDVSVYTESGKFHSQISAWRHCLEKWDGRCRSYIYIYILFYNNYLQSLK